MNWESIYKDNVKKLLGIAKRYVYDTAVAEDIVHDTFITAMQRADQYNFLKGTIYTWMSKILINKCLNYIRDHKTVNIKNEINDTETIEMNDSENQLFKYDFSQGELLEFVHRLPQIQQTVFNLYVIDKFSHDSIAKQLSIPVNTSKSHLSRARKRLQEIINQEIVSKQKTKPNYVAMFLCVITLSHPTDYIFAKGLTHLEALPIKNLNIAEAISKNQIVSTGLHQSIIYSVFKAKALVVMASVIVVSSVTYYALNNNNLPVTPATIENQALVAVDSVNATPIKSIKLQESEAFVKTNVQQDTIRETVIIHKTVQEKDTIYVVK